MLARQPLLGVTTPAREMAVHARALWTVHASVLRLREAVGEPAVLRWSRAMYAK